jgi:DNA-binding MarR family transcriptional regulator
MGLVTKKTNPEDARLNVLTLTEKMHEQSEEMLSMKEKLEKNIEEAVGAEDMAPLIKGLTIIKDMEI